MIQQAQLTTRPARPTQNATTGVNTESEVIGTARFAGLFLHFGFAECSVLGARVDKRSAQSAA